MAGVLTSQLGNIDKITFFMEECKLLGLDVLGPDVNESSKRFSVNKKKEIRFGLGGIKGTGDAAVDAIIEEREKGGFYTDIFDFITRVNLRTVNKKTLESLVYAGAFDCFKEVHRACYFSESEGSNFIEKIIRYANKVQDDKHSAQNSLFGDMMAGDGFNIQKPKPDIIEPWGDIEKLKNEKEVVGFYISGHPLDQFSIEMSICKPLDQVFSPENLNRELQIGGVVSAVQIRQSKNGNPFGIFKIEDYNSSIELMLFGKEYLEYTNFLALGLFVFIKGKVQTKWNREGEFEFKPIQIDLLNNLKTKKFKEIRVKMDIADINTESIFNLKDVISAFPGTFELKFNVFDQEEKMDIAMFSRSIKIDLNKTVQKKLLEIVGPENVTYA